MIFRKMNQIENNKLFFEYAALHFKITMESRIRERKKAAFKQIVKKAELRVFNKASNKIFFKIGLATLLLFNQKSEEKSVSWAFKKWKKKFMNHIKEEQRIFILRKKFHRLEV